jgi:hypothetical protein
VLLLIWGIFAVLAVAAVAALWSDSNRAPIDLSESVWPTAAALVLALLSWPVVALALDATVGDSLNRIEPPVASRWTAALSAVLASALVAGTLGGPLTRRHAKAGATFTFMLALLVAVPALPLLPSLLGQNVGAGWFCLDSCGDVTSTSNLGSGFFADIFFPFAPFFDPLPVLALVVGVVIWTRLVRQHRTVA